MNYLKLKKFQNEIKINLKLDWREDKICPKSFSKNRYKMFLHNDELQE